MEIKTFEVGVLGANCHAVIDGEKCLLIDLGGDYSRVLASLKKLNVTPLAVLFTHGHFDHIAGGLDADIPLYIYKDEVDFLNNDDLNLATAIGSFQLKPFEKVNLLEKGKNDICGYTVEVIHTPGHTKGSCSFKIGNALFPGDTIFRRSYGRYDFPTGSFNQLKKSVVSLLDSLPLDTVIYPGHGEATTVQEEKEYNQLYLYAKNN